MSSEKTVSVDKDSPFLICRRLIFLGAGCCVLVMAIHVAFMFGYNSCRPELCKVPWDASVLETVEGQIQTDSPQ